MATLRPRLRSERGAELIEMALVLPILLLVLVGIVEFGFMFQRFLVLTNAANEGARVAILPTYGAGDAEARAIAYAVASGLPANTVNAVMTPNIAIAEGGRCASGRRVTVTHAYQFTYINPITAMFGPTLANITLTGTSTMREQGASVAGACP
jgi:Flp pilus assembly protein TadG